MKILPMYKYLIHSTINEKLLKLYNLYSAQLNFGLDLFNINIPIENINESTFDIIANEIQRKLLVNVFLKLKELDEMFVIVHYEINSLSDI